MPKLGFFARVKRLKGYFVRRSDVVELRRMLERELSSVRGELTRLRDGSADGAPVIEDRGSILSGISFMTDIGLAGLSKAHDIEAKLASGQVAKVSAQQAPTTDGHDERSKSLSTKIAMAGDTLPLSLNGSVTLNAIARVLRTQNG